MSAQVRVAGFGAALGLVLFLFAEILLLAATVGLAVALSHGLIGVTLESGGGTVLLAALTIAGAWWLIGAARQVTRIEILESGAWRLFNAWGFRLYTLPADRPRTTQLFTQQRFVMVGAFRAYTAGWLTIEADGRRFRSWTTTADTASRALATLPKGMAT